MTCATTRTLYALELYRPYSPPPRPQLRPRVLPMHVAIGRLGILLGFQHDLGIALHQFLCRGIVQAYHERHASNLFYQAGQVAKLLPNMGTPTAHHDFFRVRWVWSLFLTDRGLGQVHSQPGIYKVAAFSRTFSVHLTLVKQSEYIHYYASALSPTQSILLFFRLHLFTSRCSYQRRLPSAF